MKYTHDSEVRATSIIRVMNKMYVKNWVGISELVGQGRTLTRLMGKGSGSGEETVLGNQQGKGADPSLAKGINGISDVEEKGKGSGHF
jgi:hypothetical protein